MQTNQNLDIIYNQHCPICNYGIVANLVDFGALVDSTHIVETNDRNVALQRPKLEHHFCYCPRCETIYNDKLDYSKIAFDNNQYRCCNLGKDWQEQIKKSKKLIIEALQRVINSKPKNSTITILEIGFGDGYFIEALAEEIFKEKLDANHTIKFFGCDLSPAPENTKYMEYKQQYFEPEKHISEYNADIIILEQVIGYFENLPDFLDNLALNVAISQKNSQKISQIISPKYLFVSEAHFDELINTHRYNELYYTRKINLSKAAFEYLMFRTGKVIDINHDLLNGESSIALVELTEEFNSNSAADKLNNLPKIYQNLQKANDFYNISLSSIANIKKQILDLYKNKQANQQIAIWGAAARGANFMNLFEMDYQKFPLVVDSDRSKSGFYVPGTGQQIQHYDCLKNYSDTIIIIATQWRAKEIYATIKENNINYSAVYVLENGNLVKLN